MTPQQMSELALLALCVWREASNQSPAAKLGVAWSIKNRTLKPQWWGTDYLSVLGKRLQYSSFTSPGDPNLIRWPLVTDPSWADSLTAAQAAYLGDSPDPTGGATSYYSVDISPPYWVSSMVLTVQIDSIKFFK